MTPANLFDKYYFSRPSFETGISRFQNLLARDIPPGARVLEIGAGASNPMSQFLAARFQLEGVDVSDEVLQNEFLRRALTYNGGRLPFEAETFDACVSYYVMEHVADPYSNLREVARVLRTGGAYFICTPNLWHYAGAASALLPHWAHRKLANRLRGLGPDSHEPYPTLYRANTARSLRKTARLAGLTVSVLDMIEFEPCYGRWRPALFYPMMAYERIVNSSKIFAPFRVNIHAKLVKPRSYDEYPAG